MTRKLYFDNEVTKIEIQIMLLDKFWDKKKFFFISCKNYKMAYFKNLQEYTIKPSLEIKNTKLFVNIIKKIQYQLEMNKIWIIEQKNYFNHKIWSYKMGIQKKVNFEGSNK